MPAELPPQLPPDDPIGDYLALFADATPTELMAVLDEMYAAYFAPMNEAELARYFEIRDALNAPTRKH